MGRTSTARDRLIDATGELIQSRGYSSLGVAEICAKAEVKKGSFYHFFASKQALTVEVVNAYWNAERDCWTAELAADGPALNRLRRLLDTMAQLQHRRKETSGTVDGCLLGNLALELSTQEPAVRARLEEIFDEQVALVAATLDDAADEGTVPRVRATAATARAVVAHLEGLVMFAKLKNDPTVLDDLWPHALLLLGAAD
ncbi:TetR/AcrR family transcriptional regulator [Streptomyces longwoodensis]|uniref:TetR/AcrR family transcriptional regulator n=1 Tax=Streptomyces longwoodensis TaxID=68231 RepID=UPI002E806DB0|nr:TetR/AcrR family transcriptional regulator [Streptomyces longwoodensis]WUC55769.1 TetR/AcrR family transcriptional regulator [Streptomyces longwoodensis]WUC62112.1 TetR/AcrR family transcriptional regulator [Streptomyces longwoodensis]